MSEERKLTDNEKAATFIGWEPGWLCSERVSDVPMLYACDVDDLKGEPHYKRAVPHDIPAPDMSRPDNYMRALEAKLPEGYEISFESAFGHFECLMEKRHPDGTVDIADWSGSGPTIGLTVVEALAALYDAKTRANA